jgi:hypothetical protein
MFSFEADEEDCLSNVKIIESIFSDEKSYYSEENIFEIPLKSNPENFAIEEDNSKALMMNEHTKINSTKDIEEEKNINIKNRNELYFIDSIIAILRKNIIDPDIRKKLDEKNNIEHLYHYIFICKKKKTKTNLKNNCNKNEINLKKGKRGKKPEKIGTITKHDKWTPDNILRKIKGKLFNKYIRTFLNKMIGLQDKKFSEKLVKLNHKDYITTVQKKTELKYLNMTLKDLFSEEGHNKSILEKVEKSDTINFILNLTYNDFIDLFTHKKTIEEINQNQLRDIKMIKDNLPGVETMFADLLEESDDNIDYSLLVIFYLFNLERSINMKQDRKRTKIK